MKCKAVYCGRACSGVARRDNKTVEQKKVEKRTYDKEYRIKNFEKIAAQKVTYNETSVGRAMQKRARNKLKEYHLAYVKTPVYRAYKKTYDAERVAKAAYGEFWESSILMKLITEVVDARSANLSAGTYNKTQRRKQGLTY